MVEPASGREFARMYVEVVGGVRQARDEAERAALLQTAEYFYRLSIEAAQLEGGVSAASLKKLGFGEMHDLADMFEGWAQDPTTMEPERCWGLADKMRTLADLAGPAWVRPPREPDDDRESLLAFLARTMRLP
jgi:hypothetical protein